MCAGENPHQIEPGSIGERVPLKVFLHPITEGLLAQDRFQLADHNRRFIIDDRAVERARLIQVCEILPDRIGAGSPIYSVCGRIVRQEKPKS